MALVVYGGALLRFSPRLLWPWLTAVALLELPMSVLAFDYIRQPLDHFISPMLAGNPILSWVKLLYAPLTEEPAKLWPLLLPVFFISNDSGLVVLFLTAAASGGWCLGSIFLLNKKLKRGMLA